ncbi:MAG: hypothetical protein R6T96_11685 [Longimicrobiales bacterium]
MLAIADMIQPSTAERLSAFDPERKKLVLRTRAAGGRGFRDRS